MLEEVFSAPTAAVENVNDPPVGTVLISDVTPTETQPLTAINAFTDADGVTAAVFAYQWQQSAPGGGTTFTDIVGATTELFTPGPGQVNRQLRSLSLIPMTTVPMRLSFRQPRPWSATSSLPTPCHKH